MESLKVHRILIAEDEPLDIFTELPIIWQTRHLGEVKHVFSHLRWHLLLFYGRTQRPLQVENSRWLAKEAFSSIVFPKIQQKLVQQWSENEKVPKDF